MSNSKSDLRIILDLIKDGDFRNIEGKIIDAKCGCGCNQYAVNTPEENEENKLLYNTPEEE